MSAVSAVSGVTRPSYRWPYALAIALGLLAGCLGRLETRATPLSLDELAPAFALESHEGEHVTLNGLLSRGPAVIVFYRGHW